MGNPPGKIAVVHIITKLELGGAQLLVLYLVNHLNRDVFSPYLISGSEGILVEDARRSDQVESYFLHALIREIRPLKDLNALVQITRLLRKIRKTHPRGMIVHTHSAKAGILGRSAARVLGLPIVIHTLHGFSFSEFHPFFKKHFFSFMERVEARITTLYFVVSRANLEKGLHSKIFKHKQTRLVPGAIELAEYTTVPFNNGFKETVLGAKNDAPIVTMVACFKPQKSPLDFVKMAYQVSQSFPSAKFVVAGDGELRPDMERSISDLGLDDKVLLLGWRRDVPRILRHSDIFVLTSLWEGLPLTFLEAMASGLPIVATDVDGARDVIVHGDNGFLVPPRNPDLMASRVLELLENPEKRKGMGNRSQDRVREFDIHRMVKKHENIYSGFFRQSDRHS